MNNDSKCQDGVRHKLNLYVNISLLYLWYQRVIGDRDSRRVMREVGERRKSAREGVKEKEGGGL